VIPPTAKTTATLTLSQGTLHLTGTQQPKVQVDATGALIVKLSGSPSAPTLTFTETGLDHAEQALGLVSPFHANGQPLIVPVTIVKKLNGC
jgi:hypothetical protein